jgi:signal transduction histidine kinase
MNLKKLFCTLSSLAFIYGVFINQSFAAEVMKVSQAEVEQFVKQAKDYAIAKGKEQALKDFMDANNTQFRKGSLYIFAEDYNGINLAHIKPAIVGSNMLALKDPNGVLFIQQMMELTKKEPNGGWTEYMWQNPTTNMVEKKYTFVIKIDDNWWIGAGFYESEKK